jgi:hypothetical protein
MAGLVDENALFKRVAAIIENRKGRAVAYANSEGTLMFWEVGQYINLVILDFKRAGTAKRFSRRWRQNWSRDTERAFPSKIYIE